MRITDPNQNEFALPPHIRLSVCHICQRFMIPFEPRREELTTTMHYRAMGKITERANTRAANDRPWCKDCRREFYDVLKNEKLNSQAEEAA